MIPLKPAWKKHLPQLFIVAGVVLLVYVSLQYYGMYSEQKRLTQIWEQQNSPSADKSARAKSDDGLTRLLIPKINVDAIVVEGAGNKQLKIGPGRITTTALPGEPGNSVITAHRDTFFRHIYELQKGDRMTVQRNGELMSFEVVGKKIVNPEDLSVLKQTADAQLTLITCYPTYYIGPAPERLVVTSKLVDRQPANAVAGNTGIAQSAGH